MRLRYLEYLHLLTVIAICSWLRDGEVWKLTIAWTFWGLHTEQWSKMLTNKLQRALKQITTGKVTWVRKQISKEVALNLLRLAKKVRINIICCQPITTEQTQNQSWHVLAYVRASVPALLVAACKRVQFPSFLPASQAKVACFWFDRGLIDSLRLECVFVVGQLWLLYGLVLC